MTDTPEDAGHGALFKNDKKEKPSHPDYQGDCTISGRKFWLAAWLKEGQKGKYMSLAFRPAEEEAAKPKPKPQAKAMAPGGRRRSVLIVGVPSMGESAAKRGRGRPPFRSALLSTVWRENESQKPQRPRP